MSFLLNSINISWILPGLGQILLFIDGLIYAILDGIIGLIFLVGNLNLNALSGAAGNLVANIKNLVGIYILFKASLLFIQYLIEPDAFKDKAKGGESFVKSVIVVLVLLTLLTGNLLFGFFNDIQKVVFGSNTNYEVLHNLGIGVENNDKSDLIQKIVFGENINEKKPAHWLTVKIAEQFIYTCKSEDSTQGCIKKSWNEMEGVDIGVPVINDIASFFVSLVSPEETLGAIARSGVGISFIGLAWAGASLLGFSNLQYTAIISSVVGIYMIMKFMKVSMSLVSRFFKLFLMQVLAPIAIVSYVTPDGKKTFQNFWKTYFSLYLELFLRLFIMYVSIYLMIAILGNESIILPNTDEITLLVLKLVLIIGVSKFMDEMPELVAGIFGTKLGDPKSKTLGNIFGAVLGGGIGAGIGLGAAKAAGVTGWGIAANAGMGLFGGAKSGLNSQNVGAFVSGQVANATKSVGRGYDILQSGGKLSDYMRLQADRMLGNENAIKRKYNSLNEAVSFHADNAASIVEVDGAGQTDYAKGFMVGIRSGEYNKDLIKDASIYAGYDKFNSIQELSEFEAGVGYSEAQSYYENGGEGEKTFTNKVTGDTFTVNSASDVFAQKEIFRSSRFKSHKEAARKDTTDYIERLRTNYANVTNVEEQKKKDAPRTKTAAAYEKGKARVEKYNAEWGLTGDKAEIFIDGAAYKEGSDYYDFGALEDAAKGRQATATGELREFMGEQRNRNIISGGGKSK